MTTLLLLRLRFKLITSGRTNRLLLAEEATGLAFGGMASGSRADWPPCVGASGARGDG